LSTKFLRLFYQILATRQNNRSLKDSKKNWKAKGIFQTEKYTFVKSFLRESISQKVTSYTSVDKNESVLPSPLTRLVNLFIIENQTIMTIDSDALVRLWSLYTGECIGSYPIELRQSE
jgi:hypothetical protein